MQSSKIENLENIKKIYFIGIGGSGMFPIAQILKHKGFEIAGTDTYESDTLDKVRKLGIQVNTEHKSENVIGYDLVVFSAAIKETNPEIQAAIQQGIPIVERSVMLGIIFKDYANAIGVAGTHGKTTTTSMITTVLIDADKSPTSVIGGTLSKINGNSSVGDSDIIVGEACEYVDSFLQLYPKISVITNVDADHLDYFGTLENVIKSFAQFASQTSELLIVNGDDDNAVTSVKNASAKKIFFGFNKTNDYYADNISFDKLQCADFDIISKEKKITHIKLNVPGKHNVYDALAAFVTCSELGVEPMIIAKALHGFTGAHRRFEILYNKNGIVIADDFAHHPTEIEAILSTVKSMNFNKMWTIFQPHTFSRTYKFLDEFAKALSISDEVIISDILPVREVNTYGVKPTDLTQKMQNAVHIPTFEEITEYILSHVQEGDIVLTMGGGNVYKCANMIVDSLNK